MSAINPTLRDELCETNRTLEDYLRGRFGMSIRVYKTIKSLTQLLAVAAGIYAMSLGAEPTPTFAIVGAIVAGPEILEYVVVQESEDSDLEAALQESDLSAEDVVDQLEDGN